MKKITKKKKGSIRTTVIVMLLVFAGVMLASNLISLRQVNAIRQEANSLSRIYLEMEKAYGKIGKNVEILQKYTNMESLAKQTDNKALVKSFRAYASGIRSQAILIRQCSQVRKAGKIDQAAQMVGTSILESIMVQEGLDLTLEADIDATVQKMQDRVDYANTQAVRMVVLTEFICVLALIICCEPDQSAGFKCSH